MTMDAKKPPRVIIRFTKGIYSIMPEVTLENVDASAVPNLYAVLSKFILERRNGSAFFSPIPKEVAMDDKRIPTITFNLINFSSALCSSIEYKDFDATTEWVQLTVVAEWMAVEASTIWGIGASMRLQEQMARSGKLYLPKSGRG